MTQQYSQPCPFCHLAYNQHDENCQYLLITSGSQRAVWFAVDQYVQMAIRETVKWYEQAVLDGHPTLCYDGPIPLCKMFDSRCYECPVGLFTGMGCTSTPMADFGHELADAEVSGVINEHQFYLGWLALEFVLRFLPPDDEQYKHIKARKDREYDRLYEMLERGEDAYRRNND